MKPRIMMGMRLGLALLAGLSFARMEIAAVAQVPGVSITQPAKGARVLTNVITVRGTTPTNSATNVLVWIGSRDNALPAETTNGWRNWASPQPLLPGTNWIHAQSMDAAGQSSVIVSQSVYFAVFSTLTLVTNLIDRTGPPSANSGLGVGSVFRSFKTNWLEVGKTYTVTATPGFYVPVQLDPSAGAGSSVTVLAVTGTGLAFSNWTDQAGQALTNRTEYKFTMASNLTLQANFIFTNGLKSRAGTYEGLFFPTRDPAVIALTNCGSVRVKLNGTTNFSGRITQRGTNHPFSGSFNRLDQAAVNVSGPGGLVWRLRLSLETDTTISGSVSTADWESPLRAVRLGEFAGVALSGSQTLLVMPTNSFSFNLEGDDASHPTNSPAGFGATKVTSSFANAFRVDLVVDPRGNIISTATLTPELTYKLSGELADGTSFTDSSGISDDGWWPLYVSLYGNQGFLIGWINLATNDPAPLLIWNKSAKASNKYYPNGFSVSRRVLLSAIDPAISQGSLNWTHGILVAGGGNLPEELTNRVVVTSTAYSNVNGAVTVNTVKLGSLGTNNPLTNLTVTVDLLKATFSGSFTHPASRSKTTFKGGRVDQPTFVEIVPVWNGGWFKGTNQAGFVRLEPDFVPNSVIGLTAHLSISSDPAWADIVLLTNGFTQTGATSGAGTNLYTKLSTTTAQLVLDWMVPLELFGRLDQINFTFASPFDGTFTFTSVNPDAGLSTGFGTFWLESSGDPAPVSLAGQLLSAAIPGRTPLLEVFGTNSYTQTGPGENTYAVGTYTYQKRSPTLARLITVATAPPNVAGQTNQIDLRFPTPNAGFYTNSAGVGGYTNLVSTRFTLKGQTNVAPASLVGQIIEFTYPKQAGVLGKTSATNTFATTTFVQAGFESGSGDYTYQVLSPNGAMLVLAKTAPAERVGDTNHLLLTFSTTTKGTFGDSDAKAGGTNGFRTGTFRLR